MARRILEPAIVGALAVALSGCLSSAVRNEIDGHERTAQESFALPSVTAGRSSVQTSERLFIPVRKVSLAKGRSTWLTSRPLTVDLDNPVPLTAVIRMIADQGVNIVSDLPLDGYTWAGKINHADTETALRMILGGVGLDYDIDEDRRLVMVRPVRSRTWTLNLGNRATSYASGGNNTVGLTENDTSVTDASNGGVGSSNNNLNNSNRQGGGLDGMSGAANGARIINQDNFWTSLKTELDNRLQVRLPAPSGQGGWQGGAAAPAAAPAAARVAAGSGQEGRTWIGTYSLNPETGSVTVSAPHWILSDLDTYMARVQAMYNAELSFEGELLMVSRSRSDTEGLDISAFGDFAKNRYGAVLQNNALGGVTLSFPSGANNLANATAGAQQVGGALLGIASPADSLQIFNAWLSEVGRVSVVQKPRVTTTSGVPGEFSKEDTTYFNLVSQETASGGVGGAVSATKNTLQSKTFGTQLTVNPRYDYGTGLIRAQITLNHVLPAGTLVVKQTINVGDSFQTIPTEIPLDTKLSYNGEALLRDGDLIVVGGQNEESRSLNENGLPGNRGTISGIFGTKTAKREYATYYFALRVKIKAR